MYTPQLTTTWMNKKHNTEGEKQTNKNKLLQLLCYRFLKTTCTYVVNNTTLFLQDKWMLKHKLIEEWNKERTFK